MDPLSALGLTSGIVQLIDFTTNLIRTSVEVHGSLDGATLDNQNLEQVCERMYSVLETVQGLPTSDSEPDWLKRKVNVGLGSLKSLCEGCRSDCEEVLGVLQELKTKNGGHKRWGAMSAAFKSLMKRKKLEDIEIRLDRTQRALSIHLSIIMRDEISMIKTSVERITHQRTRLGMEMEAECRLLTQKMDVLQFEVHKADSDTKSSHSRFSKELIDKMSSIIAECNSRSQEVAARQAILSGLRFRELPFRHQAITDAHGDTFKWIYESGNFRSWLESGMGIFWISGKPGAGKSTLMKYLADNPRTQQYLDEWAAPSKATISAHYFWILGTPLQKSLLGLLQTLIFHVLSQIPNAIPIIDPSLWRSAMENYTDVKQNSQWSMERLLVGIERIARHGDLGVKLCLFIDGLDEFDGDHLEVCNHLISLAKSPNIKICLSSRPWNVFVDKFGGNRDMRLDVHELTGDDIKEFANKQLQSHHLWETITIAAEEKQSLVEEIRIRANGVFLWVVLVTKSLCDGLTNRDTIYDLRRRLELLPVDLENLFRLILERVDPAYSQKSAEYLLIALHQEYGLPVEAFLYHEKDHENGNYAMSWPTRQVSGAELDELQDSTGRRISALTGGLLEVHQSNPPSVDFLHRTVAEFLRTKDISDYLHARMRHRFDIYVALVKLLLVILKTRTKDLSTLDIPRVQSALDHAKKTQKNNFSTVFDLLDAMEITLVKNTYSDSLLPECDTLAGVTRINFREVVLKSGFTEYVSRRLFQDRSFLARLPIAPMETVLGRCDHLPPIQMLDLLRQFGHDINESTDQIESPWCRYFKSFAVKDLSDYLHAFKELIQLGADPNANLHDAQCDQSIFSAFLSLAFTSRVRIANLDPYLSTLDVYLDHGADFRRHIEHRPASPVKGQYWWPDQISSQHDTIANMFHKALSLMESDDEMTSRREIVFDITKRIISKRANDPALTSDLHEVITKAFPASMALVLCGMLPSEIPEIQRQRPKERRQVLETSQHQRRSDKGKRTTCESGGGSDSFNATLYDQSRLLLPLYGYGWCF